jgi:multisubunit Na+/H+ antiporter MnhE subunit
MGFLDFFLVGQLQVWLAFSLEFKKALVVFGLVLPAISWRALQRFCPVSDASRDLASLFSSATGPFVLVPSGW